MMLQKLISTYISRSLTISFLLLLSASSMAQQRKIIKVEPDTIPMFRDIAVSGDLVGVAQMVLGDYGQYEAALRVNLKDKYFPIIEIGYGKADAEDIATSINYKTSAPYGRIGVDFNLMKNKHDIYRLYGGFRYGYTNYKYDLSSQNITDPTWGDNVEYKADGVTCNYHWLEGVLGVDAKLFGPVRLGWSFRYKRRIAYDEGPLGKSWYVPGFGKTGGTRLGGTFNVIFEL